MRNVWLSSKNCLHSVHKKLDSVQNKIKTLQAGFKPARAMPIGFRVQCLNHSAITAHD